MRAEGKRGAWAAWGKAFDLLFATPALVWHRDPIRYYEYLGDDVVEGERSGFTDADRPLWLNLGYWKDAKTHPEAARALAELLAETAELGPADSLLDVGFGFAEQDLHWVRRYGVKHITGLNLSPMQVERARARVAEQGLADRLSLQLGSATEMPFETGGFDKVTALECAHHFQSRERFFAEAFRVLRPGGRLAIADGLPLPGARSPSFTVRMVLRRWAYALENFYDRDVYAQKLAAAGFVDVRAVSIREHVFPGLSRYAELRREGMGMQSAVVALTDEDLARGLRTWDALGVNDYVVFSADKPR